MGSVDPTDAPPLEPRFEGEPTISVAARAEASTAVQFLKRHSGGSEAALFEAMRAAGDPAPPATSTTGQWVRGEVSSLKRSTKTAFAFDMFGRGIPGYPPTGRSLQAIVRDVAPIPGRAAQAGDRVPVVAHQSGQTVVIDARVDLLPGEQVEDAVVTGQRETGRDGKRQVMITIVVTTVTVVLVVVAAFLMHNLLGDHRSGQPADRPSPSVSSVVNTAMPRPQAPAGVGVERLLTLDRTNFCTWHLGTNPIPLVALSPVTMRIDARCNYPAEPDPGKDPGAAVYSAPSNDDPDLAVGRLGDGSAFDAECWVRGDRVADGSTPANVSRIWIRAASPDGFVPDVNVGGGYSLPQLRDMGLLAC